MDFIERMRDLKKKASLTNTGVAEIIGQSHATVRNWFNGSTEMPASIVPTLATLFNTTADYILTGNTLEGQTMVQEPGVEYGLKNLKIPPDEALRASVEALISMYHRIELLTKKTNVLELEMSEMKTKKV